MVGGEEGELVPALIARGRDSTTRAAVWYYTWWPRAVKGSVGHAKVVCAVAEAELSDAGSSPARPAGRAVRPAAADHRWSFVGRQIHLEGTLPHLVAVVEPEATPTLEQRLDLGRSRIHHQRGHRRKDTRSGTTPQAATDVHSRSSVSERYHA